MKLTKAWNWLIAEPNDELGREWLFRYCGNPKDWAQRRFDLSYFRKHIRPLCRQALTGARPQEMK